MLNKSKYLSAYGIRFFCLVSFFIFLLPLYSFAEEPSVTEKEISEIKEVADEAAIQLNTDEKEKLVEYDQILEAQKKYSGLGFGVALTFTHDLGAQKRVVEAEVIDGKVRITKERNDVIRFMLETHYLFPNKDKMSGHGPFVAFQPGDGEKPLSAIGVGYMISWRREKSKSDSFNIGIGGIVDTSVNIFGDGIEENEPLPGNETKIRFKDTSQGGILALLSFSF